MNPSSFYPNKAPMYPSPNLPQVSHNQTQPSYQYFIQEQPQNNYIQHQRPYQQPSFQNLRQEFPFNQGFQDPGKVQGYGMNNQRSQIPQANMRDFPFNDTQGNNMQRNFSPYQPPINNPYNKAPPQMLNNNGGGSIAPNLASLGGMMTNPMGFNTNALNAQTLITQKGLYSSGRMNSPSQPLQPQMQPPSNIQYQNYPPNPTELYIPPTHIPKTHNNFRPPQHRNFGYHNQGSYQNSNMNDNEERYESRHNHKRRYHYSSEEESPPQETRKLRKVERKKSKKHRQKSKSSSGSNSSLEITYLSYSKFKGNTIKMKKVARPAGSSSGSSSESEDPRKKNKLRFGNDSKPLVLKDEKAITLNKNIDRRVFSYKVIGYEKPLISQEKNLFEKMKNFLPGEIHRKNFEKTPNNNEGNEKSAEFLKFLTPSDPNKIEGRSTEDKPHEKLNLEPNELYEKEGLSQNNAEEIAEETQKEEALEHGNEKSEEGSEEKDEFSFENRYFIKNPTKLCFRCHKVGHYEKTCTEELIWNVKCVFCLGDHRSMFCDAIVCFKCSKMGHKNKDCPLKYCKNCNNCNKTGHDNQNCGIVEFSKNHFSNKYHILEEDLAKIKCFVCMKSNVNHVNCHKITVGKGRKVDDLYEDEVSGNNSSLANSYGSGTWRRGRNGKEENAKKQHNYQKVEAHAMDSMEELENL